MNRSLCNQCKAPVPADRAVRDGKVYLVKNCPKCGTTETLVSSDAERHMGKRRLDPGHDVKPCAAIHCDKCNHHRPPRYAFVDVTNRCNLNCPMCADSVPGLGFVFDPPIEHFKRLFDHLATFDPLPTIALFGGEPTVRNDLPEIVKLARSYGFETRVLTNGIRLADKDYCDRLVKAKPHLLMSYDGCKASTYAEMRKNERALEKKLKAIENLNANPKSKVSYVTCLAWGLNHKELPEMLRFFHNQRQILEGVYLMPLVQTWDAGQFEFAPDRMTTEDVERFLAECFPEYNVQFISLGLASHFQAIAKVLGQPPLPYFGGHPNCESFYLLVSNGERYLPMDHYLKRTLPEFIEVLLGLEKRLLAREERWKTSLFGRLLGALRVRNFFYRLTGKLSLVRFLRREMRIGRIFRGKGIGKLAHAVMATLEFAVRCRSRNVRRRHLLFHQMLKVIILPLEDDPILETERLQRCPSSHVVFDPKTGDFKYIPVCSWRMFNKTILKDLAAHYAAQAPSPAPAEPATAPVA